MNRRNIFSLSAIAALGLAALPGSAVSQTKSLRDQLIGIWTLVSFDTVDADGNKTRLPNAKGNVSFDATGRYIEIIVINSDRPKWKSTNRDQVTADEYKSAASGLAAQYGTWSADDTTKRISKKIDQALNPNNLGVEQQSLVAVKGDSLIESTLQSGVTGRTSVNVWMRAK